MRTREVLDYLRTALKIKRGLTERMLALEKMSNELRETTKGKISGLQEAIEIVDKIDHELSLYDPDPNEI